VQVVAVVVTTTETKTGAWHKHLYNRRADDCDFDRLLTVDRKNFLFYLARTESTAFG
jgi:hypothetical protein